jgi:probable rRNA maturation factor
MVEIHLPLFYRIFITNQICSNAINAALESKAFTTPPDITLVLTNNCKIRKLNKEYRNIDSPTDVLSFPSEEKIENSHVYIGDIVISIPRAISQAKQHRHKIKSEIVLLIIHGTLHLLGFDHKDEKSKNEMWKAQAIALNKMKVPLGTLDI